MFLQMVFFVLNRKKTVVALVANTLSSMYLPLMGKPLMTSFKKA
jgi:hypothetical protein